MNRLRTAIRLLTLGSLLWSGHVFGQLYSCSVTANPVSFGNYSPFDGNPVDAVGNVRVSCSLLGLASLLVSYEIRLSAGSSSSYFPRRMYSGTDDLEYNL